MSATPVFLDAFVDWMGKTLIVVPIPQKKKSGLQSECFMFPVLPTMGNVARTNQCKANKKNR